MTFSGVLTALVTPFTPDGGVDEAAFRALVRRQVQAGVSGLVPCGTTGEAPTLAVDEHLAVIRWTVEEAGDVPVLAGIGSNDTAAAIATGKRAQELGVTGVLATAPYYNKPTQQGLFLHFSAIAEALEVEVCVYDVPGRSSVEVGVDTITRLAAVPGITTVKDATGNLVKATRLQRGCPELTMLSGDDLTTFPFVCLGGDGCISVASNVVPEAMVQLVQLAKQARLDEARALHNELMPLFRALFVQTNPLPVKTLLAAMGLCGGVFRLPLGTMDEAPRARLIELACDHGLL